MTVHDKNRRGFALPVAVFALVVVGVLVTGGFYMARQESRIGVASERGSTAFYVAERGMGEVLERWDASVMGALAAFEDTTLTGTTEEGGWSVAVTKLSDWNYLLDATGLIAEGGPLLRGATRRLGLVVKVRTADINPPAALTTVGELTVGGSSIVNGQDSIPSTWAGMCDPADLLNKPGILIDDAANVKTAGTNYEIHGSPSVASDPTLTSESLLDFGEFGWNELVALREITLPGGTTVTGTVADSVQVDGVWYCNRANTWNWGDPLNPGSICGNYFPIIYGAGSVNINSNGYGQGILLVEGDLAVQGGFTFFGPVIVRGELKTAGTGGHFNGGVIAANVDLGTTTVLGNALVQYSGCAVERAILNNAALTRATPLAERSWVDLSNVGG